MTAIDRLALARMLASNRRVLDIGGQKMEGCDPNSAFASVYGQIEQAAADYRIVDYQKQPAVDYVIDFNKHDSISQIRKTIVDVKPELILCMEMLEHVNYHFELMNELARAISEQQSAVFITLPNNGNWVFNALGWNIDHSIGFFRDIAYRFVKRSDLGQYDVLVVPCMQKYVWYWSLVYTLSFFQPFSWGFLILPSSFSVSPEMENDLKAIKAFTAAHF